MPNNFELNVKSSAPKISVAMATFNGEKYLLEQLHSLTNQSKLPFELVVCDDGSSDSTVFILRSFAEAASFPVHIIQNEATLGFADNFLKAAYLCSGDWISFCDQDDVWLPNKLSDVCDAIKQYPKVTLFLQNAYICDQNLNHDFRVFPNSITPGFHPPKSQFGFWVWLGFLQTVRRSFLSSTKGLTRPRNYFPGHDTMSHDKLTCLIANATGGIHLLKAPAALYRRHEMALTGSYAPQRFSDKIEKSLSVDPAHYEFLAEVAKETAEYIEALTLNAPPKINSDYSSAAKQYRKISEIYTLRANLYHANFILKRIRFFIAISTNGGYLGRRMSALGIKSAAKDFLFTIGSFKLYRNGFVR